jgi:hypothetical protein
MRNEQKAKYKTTNVQDIEQGNSHKELLQVCFIICYSLFLIHYSQAPPSIPLPFSYAVSRSFRQQCWQQQILHTFLR